MLDAAPASACDTTKDVEEGSLTASSPALADGTWYAHVCALDHAGNWSAVADGGPFIVDGTAPNGGGFVSAQLCPAASCGG